jgi:hypothetical protein
MFALSLCCSFSSDLRFNTSATGGNDDIRPSSSPCLFLQVEGVEGLHALEMRLVYASWMLFSIGRWWAIVRVTEDGSAPQHSTRPDEIVSNCELVLVALGKFQSLVCLLSEGQRLADNDESLYFPIAGGKFTISS